MAPLRCLDVFSGIGGITYGLRGIATPVAYCEIDPYARAVLRHNMARGRLPRAPICEDVRELSAKWLQAHNASVPIELVMAGFPCTGMSVAGKRYGFKHPDTALFYDLLRVVDQVQPTLVLLENSPNIVTMGHTGVGEVLKQFNHRGYDVRYITLGADQMGAPQQRRRWYCLAIKPCLFGRLIINQSPYHPHAWTKCREPERTVAVRSPNYIARMRMLGMSVVPDIIRHAFLHLLCGTTTARSITQTRHIIATTQEMHCGRRIVKGSTKFPTAAVSMVDGSMFRMHGLEYSLRKDFKLILDPKAYKPDEPPSKYITSTIITRPLSKTHWATPTACTYRSVSTLTERSARHIGAQVRFEVSTKQRHASLSPSFIEWIMGYPLRWTSVTP